MRDAVAYHAADCGTSGGLRYDCWSENRNEKEGGKPHAGRLVGMYTNGILTLPRPFIKYIGNQRRNSRSLAASPPGMTTGGRMDPKLENDVNRRDFLQTAMAAAGALAIGGQVAFAQGSPKDAVIAQIKAQ